MLSPESRAVAIDFLRPPAGYALDQAVLTIFSLDLEALLALPLAVLAHASGGVDEVLAEFRFRCININNMRRYSRLLE